MMTENEQEIVEEGIKKKFPAINKIIFPTGNSSKYTFKSFTIEKWDGRGNALNSDNYNTSLFSIYISPTANCQTFSVSSFKNLCKSATIHNFDIAEFLNYCSFKLGVGKKQAIIDYKPSQTLTINGKSTFYMEDFFSKRKNRNRIVRSMRYTSSNGSKMRMLIFNVHPDYGKNRGHQK